MAESKQNQDDVLTCSVCMETFREPVMLPCQHSFCRKCIGLYAAKSKSVQIDETSDTRGKDDVHLIACPVCRAPTSLGREGVAGLAPNFHLAEMVERFTTAVKVEDDIPYCSLCEEDNHAKAIKFCTICGVFYCQECLANFHPMRGPLKRHRLISALEYLSQETSQGEVSRDQQSTQQPSCARHGQPFMYCEPCRMVICVGCVVEHPGHAVRDIPSAAEKAKFVIYSEEWGFVSCTVVSHLKGGFFNVVFFPLQPAVLNKTSELEKVLQETKESLAGVMRLYSKIQENQELHTQEVEKAYCAAFEALQAWKQQSLDGIKTRYSQWSVECSAILKHFQLQTQEMERMVHASKDLLASADVEFLQGSTDFTKRYV
ncbi:probable E3 ubiquitin-protein ligase MID2 [Liolophura sinensis]|uniref:probable E3 ubiquitin-protein ligase MID2 n=1 Tax=Liolophura sinensis TaxID=3198878 RepID=UPI003159705C